MTRKGGLDRWDRAEAQPKAWTTAARDGLRSLELGAEREARQHQPPLLTRTACSGCGIERPTYRLYRLPTFERPLVCKKCRLDWLDGKRLPKAVVIHTCGYCGEQYVPRPNARTPLYCSNNCGQAAWHRDHPDYVRPGAAKEAAA